MLFTVFQGVLVTNTRSVLAQVLTLKAATDDMLHFSIMVTAIFGFMGNFAFWLFAADPFVGEFFKDRPTTSPPRASDPL